MTSGEDFVNEIADANRRFLSWRNRLGWLLDLFADSTCNLNTDHLAYIAVYLRFIGTGEVPCSEEGGHYRPSHHAKMAQQIYKRLSEIATPENVFIIRKIYPCLPSFDASFTRAEPLTRIRDIAHRNDIPEELKREIKHTLQNKLHRSAGPEDLVTSESLLKKITAPGAAYPPPFIEEFERFHEELKEFFNALSLDERLEALAEMINEVDARKASSITKFLEIKRKINTPNQMLTALEHLTELRIQFQEMLELENGPNAQQLQMADIGLEDFTFVLLSRLNNHLETMRDVIPWELALSSLLQATGNLGLGGFDAEECRAIESELINWSRKFTPEDVEQLLRIKATLERCSRLADDYCNKILSTFPSKAKSLGHALGVAAHAIKVFSESEIRNHPVFQVSKLVALLLKQIRTLADIPAWDVIVPGRASGRLVAAQGISHLPDAGNGPLIALLEEAEGEEDIPAMVAGIIVAHEIPHLSHLAVRARQGHIAFTACEERERFEELKSLAGKLVNLDVFAERVSVIIFPEFSYDRKMNKQNNDPDRIQLPAVEAREAVLFSADKLPPILSLNRVTAEIAGGKAFAARQLEELSGLAHAGFKTAPGLVIPLGVMEASLSAQPGLEKEYGLLVSGLNSHRHKDFAVTGRRLQEIVNHIEVPDEIVSGVTKKFLPNERLIVRSSSNCEDMERFAGAGLYDSVANTPPSDVAIAIRRVWASLWNKRAVMNRRSNCIRHDRAYMAVLIQKMIVPEFSFIMHTINPVTYNKEEIYIELAIGLGETLAAAGESGVPYRIVCNKQTKKVRMLAFASFSHALWPGHSGGIIMKTIDYSDISLSENRTYRNLIARRLGSIGQFVEKALGHPQDIEGVVSGDEIYLVQSRAQQGNV
ncbi:MAG: PEP/pyruvate-binding domain-containing protein [Dissulfurispiraceae bacterium]